MRRSALEHQWRLESRFRLLGKVGEGTYGLVYKAERNRDGDHRRHADDSSAGKRSRSAFEGDESEQQPLAIKVVKSHKEGRYDVVLSMATLREIKLLRELRHDNIVKLFEVHVDPREKSLALVFEYAEHDLRQIILHQKQTGRRLPEYTLKSLMWQIIKGVQYLHENWVIHRDMKPQNILVIGAGRRRGQVKVADFGLARIYQSPFKALSDVERVVVTLWYRAPELLLGAKHYTKAVDVWAIGCIFAEMLNQRELFCGKEEGGSHAPFQKDQCDKIFRVLGLPTPQRWPGVEKLPEFKKIERWGQERSYPKVSILKDVVHIGGGLRGERLLDLLSKMLELDPEKRITAAEALQHPYFTDQADSFVIDSPKFSIKEPRPRDWAFDEPDRPPLRFPVQQPVPHEGAKPRPNHPPPQANHTSRPSGMHPTASSNTHHGRHRHRDAYHEESLERRRQSKEDDAHSHIKRQRR